VGTQALYDHENQRHRGRPERQLHGQAADDNADRLDVGLDTIFIQRPDPRLDLYLQRHRRAADRDDAAHRPNAHHDLHLHQRRARQHHRRAGKTVVASPSNEVTSFTYIASGQPDLITLPDSSTVDFDYDNAQRLTTVTNTAGETINYTLNAAGKATTTAIKDSGGTVRKSSTATYDALADMLTRVGSAGATQTTSFAYDGNRNRTSVTDANSKVWGQAYDALSRMSTVTDPLTHTAAPTYDNLDNVTAQTDFDGYSTSFIYNGLHDAKQKAVLIPAPPSTTMTRTTTRPSVLTRAALRPTAPSTSSNAP
jgi:YD repeat-containing protein